MRILALTPESVGDFLLTVPSLLALQERFPDAEIYWSVPEGVSEAAKLVPAKGTRLGPNDIFPEKIDLTVCFPPAVRYYRKARQSKGKKRIGYVHGKMLVGRVMSRLCLTDWWVCREDSQLHELEAYAKILDLIGIEVKTRGPIIELPEKAREEAARWLNGNGGKRENKIIAVQLNARWPWNPLPMIRLWREKEPHTRFLPLYSREEEKTALKWMREAGMEDLLTPGIVSFSTYAALLKSCTLLISPDGGPVHVASAVGTPVMVFYPDKNRDYLEKKWHPYGVAYRVFSFGDSSPVNGGLI